MTQNQRQNLEGRVALVTGAGRGMGGAIAIDLAGGGAHVVICDIDMPALEQTSKAVEAAGARCLALRCDVSSSIEVDNIGTLHILVNNAALVPNRPIDIERRNKHYAYITSPVPRQSLSFTSNMSDEDWHRYWDVNVHGLFYCTREALAGANIFVNAMAPGGVATPEFTEYFEGAGEEKRNQIWQVVPAGRLGTMQEYASTVTCLAGDHYLVGQVISPNGGAVI